MHKRIRTRKKQQLEQCTNWAQKCIVLRMSSV